MNSYCGKRVRIYKYNVINGKMEGIMETGQEARILKIDVHGEHVMILDDEGNLIKINYRLIKFI